MTVVQHIADLLRFLEKDLADDGEHYQASIVHRATSALESLSEVNAELEATLTEYLSATASVFQIDPVSKRNWAELDPRKNDECLRRFQRLDAAGKRARAALLRTADRDAVQPSNE